MPKIIRYDSAPEAPPPTRPRAIELVRELRGSRDALRLALASRELRRLPRLDGTAAILIPGWKAPEASMGPLRLFLRSRGCDARHWGLGTNQGDAEGYSELLARRVEALVRRRKAPVVMIGWSLGGVIAREVARAMPAAVSRVVTYGSPVIGGPTFTPAADAYGAEECARISELIVELNRDNPIAVPICAIFSRRDAVVSWPACIDRYSKQVTHYEVDSTHLSMGFDPDVWRLVAEQVAASRDR